MVSLYEGKWYICVRVKRGLGWNDRGEMDFVLDGKPHLVTKTRHQESECCYAAFADDASGYIWLWHEDDFIECDAPGTEGGQERWE